MKGKRRPEKSKFTREYQIALQLLRDFRLKAGVTQIQLAEKLGMTQSHLSKIERGEARVDIVQLRRMVLAFGVSLRHFVDQFESRLGGR